jgi:uncharacterized beta barrel domain-containing protein DUF5777
MRNDAARRDVHCRAIASEFGDRMRLCQLVLCLLSSRLVLTRSLKLPPVLGLFAALLLAAPPAFAQSSGSETTDDAVLTPAEPDYRLINLPTTLRLPLYKSSFELTHRFNGNLRNGSFGDQASGLFGIDNGAQIGFEYRFAPLRHVEVIAYRTNFDRTIQLYAKYDAIHQNGQWPLSVSGLLSIEGGDNFRTRYAPSVGATISRQIHDHVALYAVPLWVHNVTPFLAELPGGVEENTFVVGLGGRVRIRPTVYISAEVTPRVAGVSPNATEYAFGIEKRAGAHLFQLNFGNSQSTTFAQLAAGGIPDSLFMGFNLTRKFF